MGERMAYRLSNKKHCVSYEINESKSRCGLKSWVSGFCHSKIHDKKTRDNGNGNDAFQHVIHKDRYKQEDTYHMQKM